MRRRRGRTQPMGGIPARNSPPATRARVFPGQAAARTLSAGDGRSWLPVTLKWLPCVLVVIAATLPGVALLAAVSPEPPEPPQPPASFDAQAEARAGGEVTVFDQTSRAFGQSAPNLPVRELRHFASGNRLFNTNWVTAPASVKSLDGLGPLFNRVSCSACHTRDGRGVAPTGPDDPMTSMLVRLSIRDADGRVTPHPVYGDQLQDRAIHGVAPEGRAVVRWRTHTFTYPDGRTVELRRPSITFADLGYGPLGDNVLSSPRVAPAVHGSGLLEAIDDATLLQWADPDDADGDGISGRPNNVTDARTGRRVIGRFGWKANQPSLRQQHAGAAAGDIGLTSPLFPKHDLTAAQRDAIGDRLPDDTDETDLSEKQLEQITFYVRHLAVPARRDVDEPRVRRGQLLFGELGCAACHRPRATTGEHPEAPALSHQDIAPFTDLLLHDMGGGLADGRPDGEATGREWRTPPLWGLGLIEVVRTNGQPVPEDKRDLGLLHDGRARTIEEAILWHGGEAEASRDAFTRLTAEQRAALLRFLRSL